MLGVDDFILISVDDHIIEPPDIFTHHLPAKYQGLSPQVGPQRSGQRRVDLRAGRDGKTAALNAVAGRPKSEYGLEPQKFNQVDLGDDVNERVKDMNVVACWPR